MKRLFTLVASLLLVAPLCAMKPDTDYQRQLRARQEQIRRYQELQNGARQVAQPAPRAPRLTQEQLDAQYALQLQREFEQGDFAQAQAQLKADERLARQLQDEMSVALARQLQNEAEQDHAAFIQYQNQEDQLAQRRREQEERYRREPRPAPADTATRIGRRVVAPCVFGRDLLALPGLTGGKLKIEGVYHVRSQAEVPNRKDWSCGFHALYNMVKLERRICNRQIADRLFIDVCQRIAPPRFLHGGSDIAQNMQIGRRIGLPHVYSLLHEQGRSMVFFDEDLRYDLYSDDDEDEVARRAENQREERFWHKVRSAFVESKAPICVHFSCNIMSHSIVNPRESEEHAVLVTAAKMANGATAIYIIDNVNEDENHISQAEIRRHVENIYRRLLA